MPLPASPGNCVGVRDFRGPGVFLANGYTGFPDALAAGPFIGKGQGVLLTSEPNTLPGQVGAFLGKYQKHIDTITGLGGPTTITDTVLTAASSAKGS